MSDLQHRLDTGPWGWKIYEAAHPWSELTSGEADNFESAHAAMVLKGLTKEHAPGNRYIWRYEGKKVFIKFERVPDGFTINDWGMNDHYPFFPGDNKPGE